MLALAPFSALLLHVWWVHQHQRVLDGPQWECPPYQAMRLGLFLTWQADQQQRCCIVQFLDRFPTAGLACMRVIASDATQCWSTFTGCVLASRRVIEEVMKRLKGTPAEGRVSYADLIALGGAYAVALTGGPAIDIPIGACP